jgi:hypothetical protein
MKLSLLSLLFICPRFTWAGNLSDLSEVSCQTTEGSAFYLNTAKNLIAANMKGVDLVSSQYIEIPDVLSKIDWVPGKLYGFGGTVSSEDQRYTGLLSFLYREGEDLNLPDEADLRIYYADIHGIAADEIMSCTLTFN